MSVALTVRLPEFTARRLDEVSKSSNLSKTDLILEGLESVFASRLDRSVTYLSDAQFEAVLDILDNPLSQEAAEGRERLESTTFPWANKS